MALLLEMKCSNLPDLNRSSSDPVISQVQHLSSYSWIESPSPTIIVPGSPACWIGATAPQRLRKDSGLIYIAQNAARHPSSPLEPLFRALYITQPSFDIASVDVISDRNNIRKLLSLLDPSQRKEDFTVNIETVRTTTVFCREEAQVTETIGLTDFRGYGHEFEKAYTKWHLPNSTGHHRILSYMLGDLKMLIRHKTEGYVDTPVKKEPLRTVLRTPDLSDMLGSLTLGESDNALGPVKGSMLRIHEGGQPVEIESTLEIKTRVHHKPIALEEVAPQLWVSQTPNLVRVYHDRGTFQVPIVENVARDIKAWEAKSQKMLGTLTALIARIKDVTKSHNRAVLTYNKTTDTLRITSREGKAMLPKDLYMKWDVSRVAAKGSSVDESPKPSTKQPTTSTSSIRIGEVEYTNIPLSHFPYLMSFINSTQAKIPTGESIHHDDIPYFGVALAGVQYGLRRCFREIGTDLRNTETLCKTFDFLQVAVLDGRSIEQVIDDIKAGKVDTDDCAPNKRLARDSAFRLIYYILRVDFTQLVAAKLYNAVQYIVSHRRTFGYKIRFSVKAVCQTKIPLSVKQTNALQKWDYTHDRDDKDSTTESASSNDDLFWSDSS